MIMKNINMKKIGIALFAILVLIQFIRPERNGNWEKSDNDISMAINVPSNVQQILETSCYDCHSNHTTYPWYTNIQPIGLWMQHHVDEGKEELNFSEFKTYKPKRQKHKLEEIAEQVNEHEMPLSSYTLIHKNAILTPEQNVALVSWAKQEFEKIIIPVEAK
jgi:hypothetical protein